AAMTGSGGDTDTNIGPLYDEELNGRSLVGSAFETATFLPADATQYFSVGVVGVRGGKTEYVALSGGASLVSHDQDADLGGSDPRFNGLVLFGSGVNLRLTNARGDASISHYRIDYQVGNGPFALACDDAIPLTGVIDRSGAHLTSPSRLTFACD